MRPSWTYSNWPLSWLCHAERAPGSNRRRPADTSFASSTVAAPVKRASSVDAGCWARTIDIVVRPATTMPPATSNRRFDIGPPGLWNLGTLEPWNSFHRRVVGGREEHRFDLGRQRAVRL